MARGCPTRAGAAGSPSTISLHAGPSPRPSLNKKRPPGEDAGWTPSLSCPVLLREMPTFCLDVGAVQTRATRAALNTTGLSLLEGCSWRLVSVNGKKSFSPECRQRGTARPFAARVRCRPSSLPRVRPSAPFLQCPSCSDKLLLLSCGTWSRRHLPLQPPNDLTPFLLLLANRVSCQNLRLPRTGPRIRLSRPSVAGRLADGSRVPAREAVGHANGGSLYRLLCADILSQTPGEAGCGGAA